ncbi:hypothetical protein Tco_0317613 [Tanacetum coccineum]
MYYTLWEWRHEVEFKRISLTGFRSCTSRSRYRSISKQTTRIAPSFLSVGPQFESYRISASHISRAWIDVGSRLISSSLWNKKEYHSDVLAIYHKDNGRT